MGSESQEPRLHPSQAHLSASNKTQLGACYAVQSGSSQTQSLSVSSLLVKLEEAQIHESSS